MVEEDYKEPKDESSTLNLSREDVLNLRKGEVIEYGCSGQYLHVDNVNPKRGVVSGTITSAEGVNAVSIDTLVERGIRIAKWQSKGEVV